jgi:hypothetical protein
MNVLARASVSQRLRAGTFTDAPTERSEGVR